MNFRFRDLLFLIEILWYLWPFAVGFMKNFQLSPLFFHVKKVHFSAFVIFLGKMSSFTPIIGVLTLFPINLASSRACFLGSTFELDWRWSMSAELLALECWFGHLWSQSVGGRCQCPRPLRAKPVKWSKTRKKPLNAKQK